MILSDELLSTIEDAAANLLTVKEIAQLCMIDEADLRSEINMPNTPAYNHYYAGKTKTLLEIRKQELQLAVAGSPQAVEKAIEFLNSMDDDEKL